MRYDVFQGCVLLKSYKTLSSAKRYSLRCGKSDLWIFVYKDSVYQYCYIVKSDSIKIMRQLMISKFNRRVVVTLPGSLADVLDQLVKNGLFTSRSRAFEVILREYLEINAAYVEAFKDKD